MASRKTLKKDVNWLAGELMSDCSLYAELHPQQDQQQAIEIINSVILKRQEFISMVNLSTSKMKRTEVKDMYRKVISGVLLNINQNYEKLSKLPRK